MKIAVFGATGGIGGQVVRQALEAGHGVTAVVRDPGRFGMIHPALDVAVVPDLTQPEPLRPALDGIDAVISGIGPRGRKDGPVASTITRAILSAMEVAGARRLVAVSAAPVGAVADGESFVNHWVLLPALGFLLRDVYADLAQMEDEIRQSNVGWTIVRPPRLVNKPVTGKYRSVIDGNVPRGYSISRADVAHAMLAALNDPAMLRKAVGVAY